MTDRPPRPRLKFDDLVERAAAENPNWEQLMEAARAEVAAFQTADDLPIASPELRDE